MPVRITFLHPKLDFTDSTARLIASVRAALAAGHHVSVISEKGSRTDALLHTGVQCFVGELPTRSILGLYAIGRARHQVAQLEPDLLHVTDGRLAHLASRVSKALRRPYVLELSETPDAPLHFEELWLRSVLLPCATFVEKAVNAGRLPRAAMQVIEHGPSLEGTWEPRALVENHRPVVLEIGTLDHAHGVDVLIDAARILEKSERGVNFLVLGEGPDEGPLRRQIRELHLSALVTIASPILPDVNTALAEADLHVSSVRSGSPGWSAVQAHGMGVPSIFSGVSSTFGWIEDRKDGLLVEPGNPSKLAESIAMLLDNRAAAKQMGVRAREKGAQGERHQRFQMELADVYAQALGLSVDTGAQAL